MRTRSGRSCVPVAKYWMNTAYIYPTTNVTSMGITYFTNLFNQYKRYIKIHPYISSTRHNHLQGLLTSPSVWQMIKWSSVASPTHTTTTHTTRTLLDSSVDCIRGFKSASPQWLLDAGEKINRKVHGLESMKYARGFSSLIPAENARTSRWG